MTFDNLITSNLNIVAKLCGDENALSDAQEIVPMAKLLQDNVDIIDAPDYHDQLIPFLVDWFANEFFTWFEVPDCEKCSQEMTPCGQKVSAEGNRVELYRCCSCNAVFEFIRHNDAAILLRTRKGRCGEFAICFMLILKSLGYDTRLVVDVNDHVWNEVWSIAKDRWVHVDSCEQAVDLPLLYEVGWGKQLEFCIAFAEFQVLDVTPRYVVNFNQTSYKREKRVNELRWRKHLDFISNKLVSSISNLDTNFKQAVYYRRCKDVEFLDNVAKQQQSVDRSKYSRRKSGGLQWRIRRGEYCTSMKRGTVIIPSRSSDRKLDDSIRDANLFEISYNSLRDQYKSSVCAYDNKSKWLSLVYEYTNLDYKYERDWKTAYLSRYETCDYDKIGSISWRFDLSHLEDEKWTRLVVDVSGKIYEDTSISLNLTVYSDEFVDKTKTIDLELNTGNNVSREQLGVKAKYIEISAALSGGKSDDTVAWQKPQLFRSVRRDASAMDRCDFRVQLIS